MPRKNIAIHQNARISDQERENLVALAKQALSHAYAPYSKFRVGAAVLTEAGSVYTGCNVENSSYGLTNCAERTAIFTAVAAEGAKMRIKAIGIWTRPQRACAPCGACRQVILEFGPNAVVLFQGKKGLEEVSTSELLPEGFMF